MKKLVFVAAALAAGLSSFAALAANNDRTNSYLDKVSAASAATKAKTPKGKAAKAKSVKPAKAVSANARKGRAAAKLAKSGRTLAKLRSARPQAMAARSAASKSVRQQARASNSRKRVLIDPVTAALTDLSLVPPDLAPKSAGNLQYSTIVSRYAASYGVPVSLAHAVIAVESNYRPDARGSAGEIGLMQIKPATARMMGYSGSAQGLYNPETNIKFGMKYLGLAHKLGGGATCGTILRYNAGHAATRMNPVSSAYCAKVKLRLAGA